jgi:hypothetical protein
MAKPIVINNWQQGIAPSPHLGFQRIVNCDIVSSPGGLKVNRKTAKKTGTTVDAEVKWMDRDPSTPAEIRALDSNGVYYESSNTGGAWSEIDDGAGAGQGLVIFKGYALVAKDTKIDAFKISDDSEDADAFTIDSDDTWHPMLVSKNDGKVYGGAGRYIFSIEEKSGQTFDPSNSDTYTFTQQALDLPEGYRVKCLVELGNNLMIGTWKGTSASVFTRVADIFPWDRSSASYAQPIELFENGVQAMITIQNQLYIFAGVTGAIYTSNGYSTTKIKQIPESLVSVTTDTAGGLYEIYPDAVMQQGNRILFGIKNNVATVGVFGFDLATGALSVENLISTGEDGSTSSATTQAVTSLLAVNYINFLLGWQDNTTYGIDETTLKYTGFSAFAESALYQVGTTKKQETFTEIEWTLSKALATGQGVKLKYRRGLLASWTTIREYLYSGTEDDDTRVVGDAISYNEIYKISDIENLQIRVELTTPGTGDDTPELLNVKLR